MWTINGALALWLGYWVFLGWVVWSYERQNRALKMENERLKRAVASGVGRAAKRTSFGSASEGLNEDGWSGKRVEKTVVKPVENGKKSRDGLVRF